MTHSEVSEPPENFELVQFISKSHLLHPRVEDQVSVMTGKPQMPPEILHQHVVTFPPLLPMNPSFMND